MKKLLAVLTIAAFLTACNDTETKPMTDTDTMMTPATTDSMSMDTTMRPMDATRAPMDSIK